MQAPRGTNAVYMMAENYTYTRSNQIVKELVRHGRPDDQRPAAAGGGVGRDGTDGFHRREAGAPIGVASTDAFKHDKPADISAGLFVCPATRASHLRTQGVQTVCSGMRIAAPSLKS